VNAVPAPLAVDAALSLLADDGEVLTVEAGGKVIDVTLPRLWVSRRTIGPLADRGQRQALLRGLHRGLRGADLTLRIKVRQHLVAELRPYSQPTRLSRLLGLAALEVHVVPGLRALLGSALSWRSQ
jgi:hypothetical protein